MTQFEITTSTDSRRQRHLLDDALEEDRVRPRRPRARSPREREHLVGHVEAEHAAGRADALRREDHVDPAARAEVEDGLALVQIRDGGRVAAAERREHRRVGQLGALLDLVERLAEAVVSARSRTRSRSCPCRWSSPRAPTPRSAGEPARGARRVVVLIGTLLRSGRRATRAAPSPSS